MGQLPDGDKDLEEHSFKVSLEGLFPAGTRLRVVLDPVTAIETAVEIRLG